MNIASQTGRVLGVMAAYGATAIQDAIAACHTGSARPDQQMIAAQMIFALSDRDAP